MKKYSQIIYLVIAVICLITFVFAFFDMISFFAIIKKADMYVGSNTKKVLLTRAIWLFIIGIHAFGACLYLGFVNKEFFSKFKIAKLVTYIVLIVLSIVAIYFINFLSQSALKEYTLTMDNLVDFETLNVWLMLDSATKGMFIPTIIMSGLNIAKLYIKQPAESAE